MSDQDDVEQRIAAKMRDAAAAQELLDAMREQTGLLFRITDDGNLWVDGTSAQAWLDERNATGLALAQTLADQVRQAVADGIRMGVRHELGKGQP
jgi:hypothetical protein